MHHEPHLVAQHHDIALAPELGVQRHAGRDLDAGRLRRRRGRRRRGRGLGWGLGRGLVGGVSLSRPGMSGRQRRGFCRHTPPFLRCRRQTPPRLGNRRQRRLRPLGVLCGDRKVHWRLWRLCAGRKLWKLCAARKLWKPERPYGCAVRLRRPARRPLVRRGSGRGRRRGEDGGTGDAAGRYWTRAVHALVWALVRMVGALVWSLVGWGWGRRRLRRRRMGWWLRLRLRPI